MSEQRNVTVKYFLNSAFHFNDYWPPELDDMQHRPKFWPLTDSGQYSMDAVPEHTRTFSEVVSRIYAVVKWEHMSYAFLQLAAKFFDADKGAILSFRDDENDFETVASLSADDREIWRNVHSWKRKLRSFSKDIKSGKYHGYLLKQKPSKPVHNVSEFFQRVTRFTRETSLVSVINKRQQTNYLIWLHRNADKLDFMPYDLELLQMVLLHMRQALDFRLQIDSLNEHLRRKDYVA